MKTGIISDHPYYKKLVEAFIVERGRPPNDLDKLSLQKDFEIQLLIGIQQRLDRIEDRIIRIEPK
jgi:hypothetical protein